MSSAPDNNGVTANKSDQLKAVEAERNAHNSSSQVDVERNPDPALDIVREHAHTHLHHDQTALRGREESVAYSKDTTHEPRVVPNADPMDDAVHRRHHHAAPVGARDSSSFEKGDAKVHDAEKGARTLSPEYEEGDPQRHGFARFYSKWKIFFHLFIWLLFTG